MRLICALAHRPPFPVHACMCRVCVVFYVRACMLFLHETLLELFALCIPCAHTFARVSFFSPYSIFITVIVVGPCVGRCGVLLEIYQYMTATAVSCISAQNSSACKLDSERPYLESFHGFC